MGLCIFYLVNLITHPQSHKKMNANELAERLDDLLALVRLWYIYFRLLSLVKMHSLLLEQLMAMSRRVLAMSLSLEDYPQTMGKTSLLMISKSISESISIVLLEQLKEEIYQLQFIYIKYLINFGAISKLNKIIMTIF